MTSHVAIVVPAYNARAHLSEVLAAARAAAPESDILVVDAGSEDGSAQHAEDLGVRVIRLPERVGPARARNVGVLEVDARVVLFLDSDCVVHADVPDRVAAAFRDDPGLVALSGSYDASPPDPGFFSQYMNLRHHFTHQHAERERATFWAGCGAVRRTAFLATGGFDEGRYPEPSIEDIELGLRLGEQGSVRLDPRLQVTHLKRWTFRSLLETEINRRAIPWSKLLLESGSIPDDLNLRRSQRVAAAIAPMTLIALPVAPIAAFHGAWPWFVAAAVAIAASWTINSGLLRFFLRVRGARFALPAFLFHQVHLTYSAAIFSLCWIFRVVARREAGGRGAAGGGQRTRDWL